MPISGQILIEGEWQNGSAGNFSAINPADGSALPVSFSKASADQAARAAAAAGRVSQQFASTSQHQRAAFLRACADEILALGDELLDTMQQETGYPRVRCEGERGRTMGQLRMFADYIEVGDYLDARIDTALPDRQPLPRPDIRYLNQALGPVAVFSVSNFPLAFSTAGGDTASALAAGCPVVVKGHSSHPGTGELVAQALHKAVNSCGLPAAVFSFLQGDGSVAGAALVDAPEIQAVGFTGSFKGGTAIAARAAARPQPIPVYAEMGSINPLLVLPEILKTSAESLAGGFITSLTMGTGQFCVNPGLVLGIRGEELDAFSTAVAGKLSEIPAGVMLNQAIAEGFQRATAELAAHACTEQLSCGKASDAAAGCYAQAAFYKVSAADFLIQPGLQEEMFGPASLLVECDDAAQLLQVINSLQGQLTGTVHGTDGELAEHQNLLLALQQKVGRIVINGFPTGVEVCSAMVHGGPFPATTDVRSTSVGTAAIMRFVRPICYQNYPEALLPDALRNANPLKLSRVVNSKRSSDPI